MRRAAKRDSTEKQIVEALRQAGADVLLLDKFDLLVRTRSGALVMLDCKSPKGRATASQVALIQSGWPLRFVETPEAALRAIGAIR
jgi:hypothetical protein